MRLFLSVAMLAFAVACVPVSVDHYQSQKRLDDGIARKLKAEEAARALAEGQPGAIGAPGQPLADSLASARLALARDAQRDYQAATGVLNNAETADRISLLLNAATKTYHAGRAADSRLAGNILAAQPKLCPPDDPRRPPRDCDLLIALPLMAALQQKRDVIFDTGLALRGRADKRLTPAELGLLAEAVADMSDAAAALAKEGGRITHAGVQAMVRDWQRDYFCDAAIGVEAMTKTVTGANSEMGRNAAALALGQGSGAGPALQQVLEQAGTSAASLTRAFTDQRALVAARYGLPYQLSAESDVFNDAATCKRNRN